MKYRIHGGHICKQRLCGTNIRSCFFPFNMLFSCLQRHSKRAVVVRIYTYPDNAARHASFEIIFGCEESGMWTATPERDAEALSRTDGAICSQFARRRK